MKRKIVGLVVAMLIILILTAVTIMSPFGQMVTSASAAPPETFTKYFYADESTYIYEGSPTTNYNTEGYNKYILKIGQDEFTYNYSFFVKFSDLEIPSDAVIQSAKIRLWCSYFGSNPNAYTEMREALESWTEDTLTWDNKPSTSSTKDAKNVGTDGPYDWDATTLVEDWIDHPSENNGVTFVNEQMDQLFRYMFKSDDDAYYRPRLQITYKTSSGEEPEPPEEPPEDTEPCSISYSVTPENPQSGDEVTIDVTATDNVAMEYVSIYKGGVEVETCTATEEVTSLECSYSETFTSPGNHSFWIFADDKGAESTQSATIFVDIPGSGTDPVVTITAEVDEDDAVPSKYRLLPMDGQTVTITATATDPDGIDMMTMYFDGIPYDLYYDPPETNVEETVSLVNGLDVLDDCSAPCTFRYSVRAYDTEDRSTRVEGEDIEVNAPWQWYWGLPFANWGCSENHTWSWSMMESIFGDEVWWNKEYGWRKPHADSLYKNKVKVGGRGGHCYGMCALSLELASTSSSISANMIQPTASSVDGLERENWNNTWPYYYARHSGQFSFERLLLKSAQYLLQPERSGSGLHPFIDDILEDIIDDLEAGNPGILSIYEGDKGHAVVPWRVVPLGGDRYNVFIYDPNRNYSSTHDSTDYSNFDHYPFIVFGEDGWGRDGWWSYQWNSSSTWNENIFYTPYDTVIGDRSSTNYVGSDPTTGITDQQLPDPVQTLVFGSGDASFYAEDAEGRKTGYVNGTLVTDIPNSAPFFESNGNDDSIDMFMLPNNATLTFHMESSVDSDDEMGTYSLMLWSNSSFYTLENISCTKDTEDEIMFSPRSSNADVPNHSISFHRGDVTKPRAGDPSDYTITIAKEFYNSPKPVGREYIFTSDQNQEDAEVELYVSDDYDDLVVETSDTPFTFSVTTKSTESLEDEPDIDYIPESTGDFSMEANEKLEVTPDDWATTSAAGSLTTGDEQEQKKEGDTPGFELIALFIALLSGIIWYHKKK